MAMAMRVFVLVGGLDSKPYRPILGPGRSIGPIFLFWGVPPLRPIIFPLILPYYPQVCCGPTCQDKNIESLGKILDVGLTIDRWPYY